MPQIVGCASDKVSTFCGTSYRILARLNTGMPPDPPIGRLRWLLKLATRTQSADPDDAGMVETITVIATVHAAIEPIGLTAWLGAEQIDTPVTHRIHIRWQPWVNLRFLNVLLRDIVLPDGSTLQEVYRIRRAAELDGRHRFIQIDAELESGVPG